MPNLTLDNQHIYKLDGKIIDGLTSTIQEAGLIRNSDPWYSDRGTKIHLATQYWDQGTLDESTIDPQIFGYLESWKQFRRDQDYTPTYVEYKTHHPELMVGAIIDRLPLLDIKSGSPEPWHILQLAVQWSILIIEEKYESVRSPMDVYLNPDGGSPKVKPYKTSEMREAFRIYCSMLAFLRWKREKGIKNGSSN